MCSRRGRDIDVRSWHTDAKFVQTDGKTTDRDRDSGLQQATETGCHSPALRSGHTPKAVVGDEERTVYKAGRF